LNKTLLITCLALLGFIATILFRYEQRQADIKAASAIYLGAPGHNSLFTPRDIPQSEEQQRKFSEMQKQADINAANQRRAYERWKSEHEANK
jgi:hypothetical protein